MFFVGVDSQRRFLVEEEVQQMADHLFPHHELPLSLALEGESFPEAEVLAEFHPVLADCGGDQTEEILEEVDDLGVEVVRFGEGEVVLLDEGAHSGEEKALHATSEVIV